MVETVATQLLRVDPRLRAVAPLKQVSRPATRLRSAQYPRLQAVASLIKNQHAPHPTTSNPTPSYPRPFTTNSTLCLPG